LPDDERLQLGLSTPIGLRSKYALRGKLARVEAWKGVGKIETFGGIGGYLSLNEVER
jgi:hypothetical protein